MKKFVLALILAISIPLIYSCTVPTTQSQSYYFNPYTPNKYNFVTKDMIRHGEAMSEKHPDADFIYNNQIVTYTFAVDESLLKKEDEGPSKKKRRKKKKKSRTVYESNNQVITTNDAYMLNKLDRYMKDTDLSDWQKSGVTVTEKNELQVLALGDRLSYQHAIYYTNAESVSGMSGKYANDEKTSFIVPTYTKNYESNGIFHDDAKIAYSTTPMFIIGNTLNLEYTKEYNDYRYLSTVYFPEDHFIKEKTISIEIPEGLDIEIVEMNFDGFDITKKEGEAPKISDDDNDDDDDNNSRRRKRKRKSKKRTATKSKNLKTINYTVKNLRALKGEYASYGSSHSVPHLLIMCKSYTNGKDSTNLMNNADALYKWYNTLASKMENETEEISKLAKDIVKGKTTDKDKISAVFYWVQDNIRYLAFEDGIAAFKPDECQNVYNKRYGDCKGMANLTKEMLKSLGYDARLTWIGTSRIAYPGTTPTLSSANHMICAVYLDSTRKNPYFLDATENYVSFGDYADRIQGRKVIIEDGDNYIVDSVPVYNYDHNKIEKNETYTIENNQLKGTIKKVYNGESKTTILSSYNSVKTDRRERALRSFLNQNDYNLKVADIKHSDFSERNTPFEINYTLNVKNKILTDENKLYVNLDWEREWSNYTIDTARYNHYAFRHKTHTLRKATLNIPSGYKVESLPKPVNITTTDFIFKLSYTKQGNTIVYTKEIIMPKGYLHRNNIKEWNKAIVEVTNFYDNYLVLTK